MTTIVAGVFVGLMAAEIFVDYEARKLAALFFLLARVPMLVVHEAGHAIVAHLCGWHVERVVLGFGQRLKRIMVGKTIVDIRAVPIEGFVLPVPANLVNPRLKSAVIYAAGPLAEALVLGLIVLLVGPDKILSSTNDIALLALQATCAGIILSLVVNLVPHSTRAGGGLSWNDGMGILHSHKLTDDYFAALIDGRYDAEKEPDRR